MVASLSSDSQFGSLAEAASELEFLSTGRNSNGCGNEEPVSVFWPSTLQQNEEMAEEAETDSFPKSLLFILRSIEGNSCCADCSSKDDLEWASPTFGCLFCGECAFKHISKQTGDVNDFGVKIRPLNDQKWKLVDIISMIEGGNANFERYISERAKKTSNRKGSGVVTRASTISTDDFDSKEAQWLENKRAGGFEILGRKSSEAWSREMMKKYTGKVAENYVKRLARRVSVVTKAYTKSSLRKSGIGGSAIEDPEYKGRLSFASTNGSKTDSDDNYYYEDELPSSVVIQKRTEPRRRSSFMNSVRGMFHGSQQEQDNGDFNPYTPTSKDNDYDRRHQTKSPYDNSQSQKPGDYDYDHRQETRSPYPRHAMGYEQHHDDIAERPPRRSSASSFFSRGNRHPSPGPRNRSRRNSYNSSTSYGEYRSRRSSVNSAVSRRSSLSWASSNILPGERRTIHEEDVMYK